MSIPKASAVKAKRKLLCAASFFFIKNKVAPEIAPMRPYSYLCCYVAPAPPLIRLGHFYAILRPGSEARKMLYKNDYT